MEDGLWLLCKGSVLKEKVKAKFPLRDVAENLTIQFC